MRQVTRTNVRINVRGEVVVFGFPNVLATRLEWPDSEAKTAMLLNVDDRTGQWNFGS